MDLILLKEKYVCRKLNLSVDNCCVYTLNILVPLQGQINETKKITKDSEAIVAALRLTDGKTFNAFGFALPGGPSAVVQPQSLPAGS